MIDMNLSPSWCAMFAQSGLESIHWSSIGDPRSKDSAIMEWARKNGYMVFTHDIDFATILALTYAVGPSVLLVRTQDVMPSSLGKSICNTLLQYEKELEAGALIVLDEHRSRIRLLPLKPLQ
ncbi:MAG: DUF5615 family PIN-like protein [bacterium]